ncbi:SMI1/KNR4 family protein [Bacillus sp. SL00103]
MKTNSTLYEMNKIEEENGYHISSDYKSFINEYGECWIEDKCIYQEKSHSG